MRILHDVLRTAIVLLTFPVAFTLLFAFVLLTCIAIVLMAPSAWSVGTSMRKYWNQTNIEFWAGDWMEECE